MYFERSRIQSPNVEEPLETMTLASGRSVNVSSLRELPLDEEADTPLIEAAGVADLPLGLKISFLMCLTLCPVRWIMATRPKTKRQESALNLGLDFMCSDDSHQTEMVNIKRKGMVITIANLAKVLGALFARVKGLLVLAFDTKALGGGLGSREVLVHLQVLVGRLLVGLAILIVAVKGIFTLKDLFESVLPISAVPHGESRKREGMREGKEKKEGKRMEL